jgi:hypothetical protein
MYHGAGFGKDGGLYLLLVLLCRPYFDLAFSEKHFPNCIGLKLQMIRKIMYFSRFFPTHPTWLHNFYVYFYALSPFLKLTQDQKADELKKSHNLQNSSNPLIQQLDETLKKFKVRRHAFQSQSFVGNHVDKCLKVSSLMAFILIIRRSTCTYIRYCGFVL